MTKMSAVVLVCLALVACGPGEMGPPGPQGEPGIGFKSGIRCHVFAELQPGSGYGYGLSHDVTDFADGTVFSSCNVSGGATETASLDFFPQGTVGADTGRCIVVRDVDATSSGYWVFETTGTRAASEAVYNDPDSIHHKRRWPLSCIRL